MILSNMIISNINIVRNPLSLNKRTLTILYIVSPFATGSTPVCDVIFDSVDNVDASELLQNPEEFTPWHFQMTIEFVTKISRI